MFRIFAIILIIQFQIVTSKLNLIAGVIRPPDKCPLMVGRASWKNKQSNSHTFTMFVYMSIAFVCIYIFGSLQSHYPC